MNKLLKPNPRLVFAATILLVIIGVASFTASVTYVIAQSGAGSLYVEEGIYPGAKSYTLWREDSTYFSKNAYGHVDYSGTKEYQYQKVRLGLGLEKRRARGQIFALEAGTSYNWDSTKYKTNEDGVVDLRLGFGF